MTNVKHKTNLLCNGKKVVVVAAVVVVVVVFVAVVGSETFSLQDKSLYSRKKNVL